MHEEFILKNYENKQTQIVGEYFQVSVACACDVVGLSCHVYYCNCKQSSGDDVIGVLQTLV